MMAAWQPDLEDCVEINMGTEEQPNLDAAIRDGECAKSIVLNRSELLLRDVTSERFDEFVSIHQFHLGTIPKEVRVVHKNTASPHICSVATPRKDALVVRRADDL